MSVDVASNSSVSEGDHQPEDISWSTQLRFNPQDSDNYPEILAATVTFDRGSTALIVEEIDGDLDDLGPRETARVLRAAVSSAAYEFDHTNEVLELELAEEYATLPPEERPVMESQMEELRELRANALSAWSALREVADRREEKSSTRPGGLVGFLTRSLGNLPDVSVPEYGEFKRPRGYRLLAVALVLAVIVGITIVSSLLSTGASHSAVAAVTDVSVAKTVLRVVQVLIGVVIVVALIRGGWSKIDKFIFNAARDEEVWFRLDAENWTWRQRVWSCVGFSLAHVLNILLVFATLGVFVIVGAAFMAVYLRQLRKTGDRRYALYVASRFHADYNMTLIGILLALMSLHALLTVLALFLGM